MRRGRRALVVDDSRAIRSMLRRLLAGARLRGRRSGQRRRGARRRSTPPEPFDLALVDWNMPVMDGLDLRQGDAGRPPLRRRRRAHGLLGERSQEHGPGPDEGRRRLHHQAADARGPPGQARVARRPGAPPCAPWPPTTVVDADGARQPRPRRPTSASGRRRLRLRRRAWSASTPPSRSAPDKRYLVEQRLTAGGPRRGACDSIAELLTRARVDAHRPHRRRSSSTP